VSLPRPIKLQRLPLIQGIVDSFAHSTVGQEASGNRRGSELKIDWTKPPNAELSVAHVYW
jgi:hypothetical protein